MNDGGQQIKGDRRLPRHPLYANKENVEHQIKVLIKRAKDFITNHPHGPKPVLFLNYSGHGCKSGRQKECLALANKEFLSDTELTKQFADQVPNGAEALGVFDCCHSGSMVDLP